MSVPILDILFHIHQKHRRLFRTPAQSLCKQPHDHTFETSQEIFHLPRSQQLHAFISRPHVARQFNNLQSHVLETPGLELSLPQQWVFNRRAKCQTTLPQVVSKLLKRTVGWDAIIVRREYAGDAFEFYPSAWLGVPGKLAKS